MYKMYLLLTRVLSSVNAHHLKRHFSNLVEHFTEIVQPVGDRLGKFWSQSTLEAKIL